MQKPKCVEKANYITEKKKTDIDSVDYAISAFFLTSSEVIFQHLSSFWLIENLFRLFGIHLFFYKQLGLGLDPQSCLHFQGF